MTPDQIFSPACKGITWIAEDGPTGSGSECAAKRPITNKTTSNTKVCFFISDSEGFNSNLPSE